MATRGYFKIVNPEKNEEEPYIGFQDVLVEAYHDGYFYEMIKDILNIPFGIFEMFLAGFGNEFLAERRRKKEETLQDYINLFFRSIPYDLTWNIIDVLQFSKPFKYHQIETGVLRYGHPVSWENCSFEVEYKDETFDTITIKIIDDLDTEDREELSKLISSLNSKIKTEANKIKFHNNTITFSITNILCELHFYNQPL